MAPAFPEDLNESRPGWRGDLRIALACLLVSNLIVFFAVWFSVRYLATAEGEPPGRRTFLQALLLWDGGWYRTVAERGYSHQYGHHSSVAFFPVYPLASLDVAMLTGLPTDVSLLVVANGCFAAALVLLLAYCRWRSPGMTERARCLVVLACALFPAGFFFHMAYSESCFLLLSVIAFYGIQRRWPPGVTAAIVGLATAARPTGLALLAPLAIDLWRRGPSMRSRLFALAVWLPVACWGISAYLAYQHFALDDALAFVDSQRSCHIRGLVPLEKKAAALATLEPLHAVYDTRSPACWSNFDRRWALSLHFANPVFFAGACALAAFGWRRGWLTAGELSYSASLLLIPYLTRAYEMGMASMGRFASVAFPLYFVLGYLLAKAPKWAAAIVLAVMALYLGLYSARFAAHYFLL